MRHTDTPTDDVVPLRAAARDLRVPMTWLRQELEAGRLPGVRAGAQWLMRIDALRAALAERVALAERAAGADSEAGPEGGEGVAAMSDHPREGRPSLDEHGGDDERAGHSTEAEPLLVSEREAARLLSVSQRHLEAMRRRGGVPHRRLGVRVLYSPGELREWVAAGCPRADGGEDGGGP